MYQTFRTSDTSGIILHVSGDSRLKVSIQSILDNKIQENTVKMKYSGVGHGSQYSHPCPWGLYLMPIQVFPNEEGCGMCSIFK